MLFRSGSKLDDILVNYNTEVQNFIKKIQDIKKLKQNGKLIITGDPKQSDLPGGKIALLEIVDKLKDVKGIGIIDLPDSSIVRHPLISSIVERI